MDKRLVEMCDELLKDWMQGESDKAKRAWDRVLRDCKNK